MTKPALSVVVPVHNEIENIESLVNEIHTVLHQQIDYEMIYIDDGSHDGSYEKLKELAKQLPTLRIIKHAQSYGQSAAIVTGVKAAHAQWIATLDGDGQNDPGDILQLWTIILNRTDKLQMVAGYRRKRQDSWLKRWSSRIANGIRSRLLDDQTPDTGCGLKLFSRDFFLTIPHFDHLHRFLPALFIRNGGEIISVEVNHRPRLRGQSKYGLHNRLWVGIIDLLGVMWLQRRPCLPTIIEEVTDDNK